MTTPENRTGVVFTREGVQNVDRDAVDVFGMQGMILMENAASGATSIIKEQCSKSDLANIVIVCGSGNNGGDGYAIARLLHNHDHRVHIAVVSEPTSHDAIHNAGIAKKMHIPVEAWHPELVEDATLIVDAIFGTGLKREVGEPQKTIIDSMNSCPAKVVAIDIPSGLDCDTGQPLGTAARASLTITFVGLKQGFLHKPAMEYLGNIEVVGIGCPQSLIKKYAIANT